jgi:imidazolonepropionase-like amidohydrolase
VSEYDLLLHGDLWDAEHGRREATWLAIRKDQIEGVYDDKPGPAATERHVDVLTPGLMDLHVHLVWDGSGDPVATLRDQSEQEQTVQAVANARAQLQGGVTTVRDLGSTHDIAISVAAAVRRGDVPGPRVYASGRTVIISGGHDPF